MALGDDEFSGMEERKRDSEVIDRYMNYTFLNIEEFHEKFMREINKNLLEDGCFELSIDGKFMMMRCKAC